MFCTRMSKRPPSLRRPLACLVAGLIWVASGTGMAAVQEPNDPESLRAMGLRYENGDGVSLDYTKAREYYEKAGEMGNAMALSRLGTMYRTGLGVPKDLDRAIAYYRKSVDLGFKWAQGRMDEALAEQRMLASRAARQQEANEARLAEQALWAWALSEAGPQPADAARSDSTMPGLAGAHWTVTESSESCYEFAFRPDGSLLVIYPNDGQWKLGRGTWTQTGNVVYFETFNGLRKQQGQLTGTRMEGGTKTRAGDSFSWIGERNPQAGNCNYRANYVFLRQRESLEGARNKSSSKGWKVTTSAAYDEAKATVDRGEYIAGFRKMMTAAESGDARAQFFVGLEFEAGNASGYVERVRAATWFRKAAAQGYPDAENHLGTLYHNGTGVPQDYALARRWYLFADADGNSDAAFNLGLLAEKGLGVSEDREQAFVWYRKAASQGVASAVAKLEAERAGKLAEQREVERKQRREENKKQAAAGLQPSEEDVLRILVAALAKYTDRGYAEYPDTLVKTVPLLGEVKRIQVSILDMDCGNPSKKAGIQCDIVTNRKVIGGLGGLTTQFANEEGTNASYSVRFIRSAEQWISPELDQTIMAMGKEESIKREAERASYRAWHEIGTSGTYCKNGNKTDPYGNVINYNDVNCY